MNTEDQETLLDFLAGAIGSLSQIGNRHSIIKDDAEYLTVRRCLEAGIGVILKYRQRMMTPQEVEDFNRNEETLLNGEF